MQLRHNLKTYTIVKRVSGVAQHCGTGYFIHVEKTQNKGSPVTPAD